MAVNEQAHVDLNDADLGDEPAILGATDCPFFKGPAGEHFTVATSLVGSRTFPSYLRAMRRADLADDPRFATAAARRAHFERGVRSEPRSGRLEAILSISARFVKTTMICHSLRLTVVTGPHGNPDRDWPETFLLDSHATIAT